MIWSKSVKRPWALLAFGAALSALAGVAHADTNVTLVVPAEPDTLAAWSAENSSSVVVVRNVEESLLNRDPATNEFVGELATSWKQEEPTRWRFILRQGVKFHDGSPFNAEAAAFALSREWDPKNVTFLTSLLGPKMTFTVVDDYTLDVTTETPDSLLPARLYVSPIDSEVAYKADPKSSETNPIGTGPYKFVRWDHGQSITLAKNPDWWGNTTPADAHGKQSFDTATFVFRKETSVATDMLVNNEANFARWISPENCQRAPVCVNANSVENLILRPDMVNPVLGDIRIRQAIADAIDRQQLLDVVLGGGQAMAQMVNASAAGFNPDLKPEPFDIENAKKLVAAAKADGVPVDSTNITLLAQPALTVATDQVLEVIADSLRQIGLKATTKIEEYPLYLQEVRLKPVPADRAYLVLARHGNELMDFSLTINNYYRCAGVQGTFCDPKMEDMAEKSKVAQGEDRIKAMQEIAAYAQQQFATIDIGQLNVHFGLNNLTWKPRLDGLLLLKEMAPGTNPPK